MMNNKTNKINFNLASRKPHQVLKAKPELKFFKHGNNRDLYACEQTGELLTMDEISSRYECSGRTIAGLPQITGFHVYSSNEHNEKELSVVCLLAVENDEIIFSQ